MNDMTLINENVLIEWYVKTSHVSKKSKSQESLNLKDR